MPLVEGLVFVHNCLVGFDLRERVSLLASGKITTGFHMAKVLALGADACYAARAMMMAIGCIQARRCNSNDCPVGVATQKPGLVAGLDVESKAERTRNFQRETVGAFLELLGAAGLSDPAQLTPEHIMRRVDARSVRSYLESRRPVPLEPRILVRELPGGPIFSVPIDTEAAVRALQNAPHQS